MFKRTSKKEIQTGKAPGTGGGGGGDMVYPGPGIAVSDGTEWDPSIPNGPNGKVLTMVAGVPVWADPTPAGPVTNITQNISGAGNYSQSII
jgi:hypothetical protein